MYYVYYVRGVKVGCTNNLEKRVEKEQGYKKDDYEVLFSSNNITIAAEKEKHFQEMLGYKIDNISYDKLPVNKLKIRVDKGTVTFGDLGEVITAERLLDAGIIKDETKQFLDYDIIITNDVCKWILKNLKKSQYRLGDFVYLNALKDKFSVEITEEPKEISQFDLIREWANAKGIYDKGDYKTQYVKLMEEAGELAKALLKDDEPEIVDAIGDIVVVLTNLAHLKNYKIENCIESAYSVIKNRTGKMENGTFKKDN